MVLSVLLGIANDLVVRRSDHALKMASTLVPGKRPQENENSPRKQHGHGVETKRTSAK